MKYLASPNNDQGALFHCRSPKISLNAIKPFASGLGSRRQAWVRNGDDGMHCPLEAIIFWTEVSSFNPTRNMFLRPILNRCSNSFRSVNQFRFVMQHLFLLIKNCPSFHVLLVGLLKYLILTNQLGCYNYTCRRVSKI